MCYNISEGMCFSFHKVKIIIVGMETLNSSEWSEWRPKTHSSGRGRRPKFAQQHKMILTKKERNEIWKTKKVNFASTQR